MDLNKIDEEQYGKEFCGFINDIKTHKNPKSFEKDESNFFSLLFNLKSDKEKIKAINGWRDYINELVVNFFSLVSDLILIKLLEENLLNNLNYW